MDESASNNAKKTRGKPFSQGNKFGRGRPTGSQNKATVVLQSLLEGEGEAIVRKAVELALEGDRSALRLCLERLLPPAKERAVSVDSLALGSGLLDSGMNGPMATLEAISLVIGAASRGELTLTEAERFVSMLETQIKMIETVELESQIAELQTRAGVKPKNRLARMDAVLPNQTDTKKGIMQEVIDGLNPGDTELLGLIAIKAGQPLPGSPTERNALWSRVADLAKQAELSRAE